VVRSQLVGVPNLCNALVCLTAVSFIEPLSARCLGHQTPGRPAALHALAANTRGNSAKRFHSEAVATRRACTTCAYVVPKLCPAWPWQPPYETVLRVSFCGWRSSLSEVCGYFPEFADAFLKVSDRIFRGCRSHAGESGVQCSTYWSTSLRRGRAASNAFQHWARCGRSRNHRCVLSASPSCA